MIKSWKGKIVGVSDAYYKEDHFWYPINEILPWGYGPFFWFYKVIDRYLANRLTNTPANPREGLLVHCDAGVCRSPMVVYAWMVSMCGSFVEACDLMHDSKHHLYDDYMHNVNRGLIPNDLQAFLRIVRDNQTFSLMGALSKLPSFGKLRKEIYKNRLKSLQIS